MNYKFKILSLVFVLSILLGFDLNAQSTFNPSGQNTSEYTDDATTNHFFYKPAGTNTSVDITVSLNKLRFIDTSNNTSYGWGTTNAIPDNWDFEILDDLSDCPNCEVNGKVITYSGPAEETISVKLRIFDKTIEGNPTIENTNTMGSVSISYRIISRLSVFRKEFNACTGKYEMEINEVVVGNNKPCSPYTIKVYSGFNDQTNLVFESVDQDSPIFELDLDVGNYNYVVSNSCGQEASGGFTIDEAYTFGSEITFSGYVCADDENSTLDIQIVGAKWPVDWEIINLENTPTYNLKSSSGSGFDYVGLGNDPTGTVNFSIIVEGIPVGSYKFIFTDANDCTKEKEFKIVRPPQLTAELEASVQEVECNGDASGSLTFIASGGWTQPFEDNNINPTNWGAEYGFTLTQQGTGQLYNHGSIDYAFDQDGNRIGYKTTFNNLPKGTYCLTISEDIAVNGSDSDIKYSCSNEAGCWEITEPNEISLNPQISDFNGFGISCNGANDGSIDLSVTGGTGSFTYSWTGPGNFTSSDPDISNLVPGTYNVTVTDENDCQVSAQFNITEPDELLIEDAGLSTEIDCHGDNGQIKVNITQQSVANYKYDLYQGGNIVQTTTTGNITHTFSAPAGTYKVRVTDANGCLKETDNITLTQPDNPLSISFTKEDITCKDQSDGSIDITVSGGTVNYSYSWIRTGGSFTSSSEDINSLDPGVYVVVVTDANGCEITQQVEITEPDELVVSGTVSDFNGFGISCNGADDGSIDLSVTGGTANYTYSWSTNNGVLNNVNSPNQSGLSPGTYNVTVTDANGCSDSESFTITEPDELSLSASIPETNGFEISCNGANDGSIDTTVSGGTSNYTYSWTGPNGFTSSAADLSNLSPGVYSLTATDTNGCSIAQTYTLTQPDAISISGVISNYNGFGVSAKNASNGSINATVVGGYLDNGSNYVYSWTGPNGFTSNNEDISNLSAGTYNLTVTDDNDCTKTIQFVITEPDLLVASGVPSNYNGFEISCNGANDGFVILTVSGGATDYTYSWTGPNGYSSNQKDISNLTPGTYNVTITDANGNKVELEFEIVEPNILQLSANLSNFNGFNVSCFSGNNGSIDLTMSGGTSNYTYSWTGPNGFTSSAADLNNLIAGEYQVIVNDSNGCTITNTYTLNQPSAISVSETFSDFNGFGVSCNGSNNGSININVSGGYLDNGSNYTFSWTGPNGFTSNNEDLSNLLAGTYVLTVTDDNDCIYNESYVVTQPEEIIINETISDYNGFQVSIFGASDGEINLDVSGGTEQYTYQWSTVNGNGLDVNSRNQSGLTIGTYTVLVTDSNNCTETETYTLSQPAELLIALDFTAFGTNILCYGDATASIKIDVTQQSVAPYDYELFGVDYLNQTYTQVFNNINNSTYTFSAVPAGQFQVKVTDANGSSKTSESITITQPNAPIVINSNVSDFGNYNISCYGANDASIDISLQGGTLSGNNFYDYEWTSTNGSGLDLNSLSQSGLGPGDYTLTVTDENNCVLSETFNITSPVPINYVLDEKIDITCKGDDDGAINISVSGGTGNYNYNWSTENGSGLVQGQQDQSGLSPGLYVLALSDGCQSIQYEYVISEPDELLVNLDQKVDILCHGDSSGEILITVNGGTAPYDYVWTDNFNNVYDRNVGDVFNDGDLTNVPAGIYELTVTDSNNCVASFNVELTQPDDFIIQIEKTDLNCYDGNDGTITVNASGGAAPYTFEWSDLGNGSTRNNLSAGTYIVKITDSNGCEETREINIENAALFDINPIINNISCFGEDDGSIQLNIDGGVLPLSVLWSDDSSAGLNRNNLSPGTYSVTISDGSGCIIEEDFNIIEPQELSLSGVITNATDCNNPASGSIDLQVSGGTAPYTFVWSNGANEEDVENLIANSYNVIVTDSNGCKAEKSFEINRQDDLEINLVTELYAICETREVYQKNTVSVSGGVAPYVIEWSNGIVSGNNGEIMDTKTEGSYEVKVTDFLGCQETLIFNIDTPEIGYPDFDYTSFYFENFNSLAVNDPITFNNLSTEEYVDVLWDFGEGTTSNEINPIHTYTKRGVYEVTLTVEFILGCSYSISKTIYIGDQYEIVIPNAFTPNNDGFNDTFRPVYYGFSYILLQVFDTWGTLIYYEEATTNELIGWDGKIKGKDAENGNYFYQVSGTTFTEDNFSKNGSFTLLK